MFQKEVQDLLNQEAALLNFISIYQSIQIHMPVSSLTTAHATMNICCRKTICNSR